MSHFSWKIHQLRGFFIIYIMVRLAIEMFLGWPVARETLEEGNIWGINNLNIPAGVLLVLIVFFTGIVMALGLWLFSKLLLRKNWARIVLLVVGWLAVADAILSLFFTAQSAGLLSWVAEFAPDLDWNRIILVERFKDMVGLLFWGYLIVVLQFNQRVKKEYLFLSGSASEENKEN